MKNPTIATLLNIIPGLGYLYVGGKRKMFGILILGSLVVSSVATGMDAELMEFYMNMSTEFRSVDYVYLVALVLGLAAFMYDAYVAANSFNASLSKKKKS